MVCSIDNNQKVNQDFKIYSIKYQFDTEHENDFSSSNTTVRGPPKCKLDLTEVKQLQGQDIFVKDYCKM